MNFENDAEEHSLDEWWATRLQNYCADGLNTERCSAIVDIAFGIGIGCCVGMVRRCLQDCQFCCFNIGVLSCFKGASSFRVCATIFGYCAIFMVDMCNFECVVACHICIVLCINCGFQRDSKFNHER